jgi:tryptophanyl-tRNA synthetase
MIPGLGGLPKMSKSLPGSGIDATMTPEAIRATLDADQDTGDEDGSALVQMHACLPEVGGQGYDRAVAARRDGGGTWRALRRDLTDRLIDLFALWPKQ